MMVTRLQHVHKQGTVCCQFSDKLSSKSAHLFVHWFHMIEKYPGTMGMRLVSNLPLGCGSKKGTAIYGEREDKNDAWCGCSWETFLQLEDQEIALPYADYPSHPSKHGAALVG